MVKKPPPQRSHSEVASSGSLLVSMFHSKYPQKNLIPISDKLSFDVLRSLFRYFVGLFVTEQPNQMIYIQCSLCAMEEGYLSLQHAIY